MTSLSKPAARAAALILFVECLFPLTARAQNAEPQATATVPGGVLRRELTGVDLLRDLPTFLAGPQCLSVTSSGGYDCNDAGGFPSSCAVARCPSGYTITGGGGACAAGDRRLKSSIPRFDTGEFIVACERQGVPPQAAAICCRF
jgi:hypothetical protein